MTKAPDFTKIALQTGGKKQDYAAWQADIEARTGKPAREYVWKTLEQIDVKPLYTADDLNALEHLGFTAGIPPYLRGP